MTVKKGIILAGGMGTRLWPLTTVSSKQLLPVYDKPMIYYPLTTLMLAGIDEVLIITTAEDQPRFQSLLRDGSQWGISIQYATQDKPEGIAQAFLIGQDFIDGQGCALILGDNIFYGAGLSSLIQNSAASASGATVFCHWVSKPERYGVLELDSQSKNPVGIEEKPAKPKSNWAVTGLYIYDNTIVDIVRDLKPSARGELEITDANRVYLDSGRLHASMLGRGFAWFDTGTHESLLSASDFVKTIEDIQGLKIGCPEEVAFRMGFIDNSDLDRLIPTIPNKDYRSYIQRLLMGA